MERIFTVCDFIRIFQAKHRKTHQKGVRINHATSSTEDGGNLEDLLSGDPDQSDLADPLMGIEMDDSEEEDSDDSMSDISDSEIAPPMQQQHHSLMNHSINRVPP